MTSVQGDFFDATNTDRAELGLTLHQGYEAFSAASQDQINKARTCAETVLGKSKKLRRDTGVRQDVYRAETLKVLADDWYGIFDKLKELDPQEAADLLHDELETFRQEFEKLGKSKRIDDPDRRLTAADIQALVAFKSSLYERLVDRMEREEVYFLRDRALSDLLLGAGKSEGDVEEVLFRQLALEPEANDPWFRYADGLWEKGAAQQRRGNSYKHYDDRKHYQDRARGAWVFGLLINPRERPLIKCKDLGKAFQSSDDQSGKTSVATLKKAVYALVCFADGIEHLDRMLVRVDDRVEERDVSDEHRAVREVYRQLTKLIDVWSITECRIDKLTALSDECPSLVEAMQEWPKWSNSGPGPS